jgi:hypothetical protein
MAVDAGPAAAELKKLKGGCGQKLLPPATDVQVAEAWQG